MLDSEMDSWNVLPGDILQHCNSYLDVVSRRMVRSVCAHYYNLLPLTHYQLLQKRQSLSDCACSLGYLSIVEELDDMISDTAAMYASLNGHLPMLMWLTENVTWNKRECLLAAVYNGHVNVVRYILTLPDRSPTDLSHNACIVLTNLSRYTPYLNSTLSMNNGWLSDKTRSVTDLSQSDKKRVPAEIIREVELIGTSGRHRMDIHSAHQLTYLAAKRGYWDVVVILIDFIGVDSVNINYLLIEAARGNSLTTVLTVPKSIDTNSSIDVYKSIDDNGPITQAKKQSLLITLKLRFEGQVINNCLAAAIQGGHIELASRLFSLTSYRSIELLECAILSGSVEMVIICLPKIPITDNMNWYGSLTYAARSGNLRMVEYIHQNYPLIRLDTVMSWRLAIDHSRCTLPILQYVYDVSGMLPTLYVILTRHDLATLQWYLLINPPTLQLVADLHDSLVGAGDIAAIEWLENEYNITTDSKIRHYQLINPTTPQYEKLVKWLKNKRDFRVWTDDRIMLSETIAIVLPIVLLFFITIVSRMYEALIGRTGWECWHICFSLITLIGIRNNYIMALLSIGHGVAFFLDHRWLGQLSLWLIICTVTTIKRYYCRSINDW